MATATGTCGHLVDTVQSNQELPGYSNPELTKCSSSKGSSERFNVPEPSPSPPPVPHSYDEVVNCQQDRDHHRCSKMQPQSQLKYKQQENQQQTVIESMRDEVMRNFIKPPPNRIIICCDDCVCSCNCRHHLTHQSPHSPSSTSSPSTPPVALSNSRGVNVIKRISTSKKGYRELCNNSSMDGGKRPELESSPTSRSSPFSSTTSLITSGLRKNSRSKNISSSNLKSGLNSVDRGKIVTRNNVNNNNNDNGNLKNSSPSNTIHSFFQTSNLIPIFLSSLTSSKTSPSSTTSPSTHGRTQPRIKGCQ